jgi:hypothetical protein
LNQRAPLKNFAVACLIALSACSKPTAETAPAPVALSDSYLNVLVAAEKRVDAGDYSGADRILSDFALKARGTQEGIEVAYWRALYMVDPKNGTASMAEGVRALDIYLSTDGAKQYRAQALVLKRTAQTVLSLRTAQATARVLGRDTVYVTREDEILALKDQLAKANAELDRIKKRLANPSR